MPIQTLIVTGQNNHAWRETAPFCKKLLEETGLFAVDVTEDPAKTLADAAGLARFDLIFLDYNGPDWDEPANTNLIEAVRGGKGLTVLHAANNPFVGWADYERMIGLQWDARSTHTRYIPIDVKIAYPTHPITSRMPDFTTTDELYGGLANRQNVPVQVLAAAWSDPEQRGTGNVEPVLIVLEFGAGRVFQSILGHAAGAHRPLESFESEHVRRLLVRGCEWAATGKVTL